MTFCSRAVLNETGKWKNRTFFRFSAHLRLSQRGGRGGWEGLPPQLMSGGLAAVYGDKFPHFSCSCAALIDLLPASQDATANAGLGRVNFTGTVEFMSICATAASAPFAKIEMLKRC